MIKTIFVKKLKKYKIYQKINCYVVLEVGLLILPLWNKETYYCLVLEVGILLLPLWNKEIHYYVVLDVCLLHLLLLMIFL